ncbi:MAG: eukaryotic-like serine/threonine-protein kinase [Acidobacteriota bacterium]|nr:eukaryotic-like serine/threonine-protein kinase [Acidobacteriota bacterium]
MIAPDTLLQNRYLVQKQIGQGGMGAVYIATDQRFGSTVALKETFFDEVSMRKAFEREARLLNHLRHPALPRVSDHFTEDEGQFLVMEYIAGNDLAEKLKERGGAFPASEVLNWADQLLDALDYLHTQEPTVIHRDIKPQNLKLTPRNHIVLLDFGLAKGTPPMQMSKVTATGSVFGYSRHYAPLEQIQGAGTDPRSDLYSLGATLYHLITGVVPPDALTRATNVLNGQPDPLRPADELHPQITPAIASILGAAMAHNAAERPQTAAAMRDALRDAARQGHGVSRETQARSTSSTDVYEQETQLIYGAASPPTATGDEANKTGQIKAGGATAVDSGPGASVAGSASTNAADRESVITKVAAGAVAAPKAGPRKRVIGIAASALVVLVLAAVVYTLTRNPAPVSSGNENAQPTPVASETANQNTAESNGPVIIIKKEHPEATPGPTPVHRATEKRPRDGNPTVDVPGDEADGRDNSPEPPQVGPGTGGTPQRPIRRFPQQPIDPGVQEALRDAAERRRAAEEARRNAMEQRRQIIQQQRLIERARRRRQQTP